MLNGFTSGADNLSAANPENDKRDKRPGLNGGEIARQERSINKKLKNLAHERELTDAELDEYGLAYFREHGVAPSLNDTEKLIKPLELNEDPCWLELSDSEHERFLLYYSNAKWFIRVAELAADILDSIEAAPKEKIDILEKAEK